MKQLWMGGSGAVTLEGTLSETLFQSGGNVSVQVRVKNETKRRVMYDFPVFLNFNICKILFN
jgi:hypothetical protein